VVAQLADRDGNSPAVYNDVEVIMRRKLGITALLAVLCALVAGAAPAAARGTAASAAYCGITWGSLPKSGGGLSPGVLLDVRTGQHPCWDRVVFDFDSTATGFTVEYGEAYTQGEGRALSPYTAGGALLNVVLLEHADGYPHAVGDHVANVLRYRTLRDVVYGGTFEGYTTFAVGVRARLPYRVFLLSEPGLPNRIVLDIAHQW
jgi:hypothetical protein